MKNITIKVLFIAMLFGYFGTTTANAKPLELVHNGEPNAAIVLQRDAPAPMQQAAVDLQKYLQKITGVKLPMYSDGTQPRGITLNIGKTAIARDSDLPSKDLNPETYAITQRGKAVYFTGNYPTPTAFAVYSFLQDQLGVRWFAPGEDWEYIPQTSHKSTFIVDVENTVFVPGTSPRHWSGHGWTSDWVDWDLRNKTLSGERQTRRNFQNNIYRIFPPSKYAETHPEYYPIVNGKRWIPPSDDYARWLPVLGNPEVQRITIEYIRQWFRDNPDQDSFALGADDIYYWGDDPLTYAMDANPPDRETGNYSNRYYKFVNIIAKEIKKSNPDKYLGVLIYSRVVEPPSDVDKLEDNVFGFIANGSVAQWYQPDNKANWIRLTQEWHKKVKHLSRYDYYGMGTFVPRIFPHAMDESIKFDESLGFEGMYTEVYTFLPHTAPMIWAFAQLQWSPEKNIDSLLGEFYSKMFPTTSPTIRKYFSLMENSWNTPRKGHVGWVHHNIVHQAASISSEAVYEGLKILDDAYNRAATPIEKHRIDVIRGGLKFASYAVLEYDLAQQINNISISDEASANIALSKVQKFVDLMTERGDNWSAAEKRRDLLGENIRAFAHREKPYLQSDFTPIESPAIPGILRTVNWYQINQPTKATQIINNLTAKLPDSTVKSTFLSALRLADIERTGTRTLVKNGNFVEKSESGIPQSWNTWSRFGGAKFIRTNGRNSDEIGINIIAENHGESASLLQQLKVRSGKMYIVAAWINISESDLARQVSISLRLAKKGGGYDAHRPKVTAYASNDWQQIILPVTIPKDIGAIQLMLSAVGTSAVFSDVRIYQVD